MIDVTWPTGLGDGRSRVYLPVDMLLFNGRSAGAPCRDTDLSGGQRLDALTMRRGFDSQPSRRTDFLAPCCVVGGNAVAPGIVLSVDWPEESKWSAIVTPPGGMSTDITLLACLLGAEQRQPDLNYDSIAVCVDVSSVLFGGCVHLLLTALDVVCVSFRVSSVSGCR
jgi:hypothetical protein